MEGKKYSYFFNLENEKKWNSEPIVHGHFNSVSDLDWDHSNNYFVTCSEDQTTRLFSYWKANGKK